MLVDLYFKNYSKVDSINHHHLINRQTRLLYLGIGTNWRQNLPKKKGGSILVDTNNKQIREREWCMCSSKVNMLFYVHIYYYDIVYAL